MMLVSIYFWRATMILPLFLVPQPQWFNLNLLGGPSEFFFLSPAIPSFPLFSLSLQLILLSFSLSLSLFSLCLSFSHFLLFSLLFSFLSSLCLLSLCLSPFSSCPLIVSNRRRILRTFRTGCQRTASWTCIQHHVLMQLRVRAQSVEERAKWRSLDRNVV